jgi:hypothetical protein
MCPLPVLLTQSCVPPLQEHQLLLLQALQDKQLPERWLDSSPDDPHAADPTQLAFEVLGLLRALIVAVQVDLQQPGQRSPLELAQAIQEAQALHHDMLSAACVHLPVLRFRQLLTAAEQMVQQMADNGSGSGSGSSSGSGTVSGGSNQGQQRRRRQNQWQELLQQLLDQRQQEQRKQVMPQLLQQLQCLVDALTSYSYSYSYTPPPDLPSTAHDGDEEIPEHRKPEAQSSTNVQCKVAARLLLGSKSLWRLVLAGAQELQELEEAGRSDADSPAGTATAAALQLLRMSIACAATLGQDGCWAVPGALDVPALAEALNQQLGWFTEVRGCLGLSAE